MYTVYSTKELMVQNLFGFYNYITVTDYLQCYFSSLSYVKDEFYVLIYTTVISWTYYVEF